LKIIVAPDSFKESLGAAEAAQAIAQGIKAVLPGAEVMLLPVADGGEGTVAALVRDGRGQVMSTEVTGPLGDPVRASWGILRDGTAVLEMAAASGLPLVPPQQRNPMDASTLGTGELIIAALDQGCPRILLGLGGSATNDGGAGALAALGVKFLDARGRTVPPTPRGLLELAKLDISGVDPRLVDVVVDVACDVDNPLLGPRGASRVFAPQKGADAAMVEVLEKALDNLARIARRDLGKDISSFPGSGAAGGLAAGLSLVARINLRPGIELVLETLQFPEHLKNAALVITGEGKIDAQSVMGKALSGVARAARERGVPVIALCGALGEGYQAVHAAGIQAAVPIVSGPMTREEAMANARQLLTETAARVLRLLLTLPKDC